MSFNQAYDLAIIGGGINGVAIARDACLRGMKVILLEKEDFGSGASTKTSKLAHGGLRYLERFEYKLVKESLSERTLLLKNAPHLVKPLPFLIPVYEGDPYPLWKIRIGLFIYDFLAMGSETPRHRSLSSEEITEAFPQIRSHNLKGGCLYYDALMRDNRIIFDTLFSAQQAGVEALNYAKVTSLQKLEGKTQVNFRHEVSMAESTIYAKVVVNASGAWSNQFLDAEPFQTEPTKGVHLVIPQISSKFALLLRAPQDARVFFLIPWENYSLLGTTDTFYEGNPDKVQTKPCDREYLIQALRSYFPGMPAHWPPIISEFAGLRPLVKTEKKDPDSISRSHAIHVSPDGLITLLGGKYTTHRKMAADTVDIVAEMLNVKHNSSTAFKPLRDAEDHHCQVGLPMESARHILENYGSGLGELLKILKNPKEAIQVCSAHPHLMGEITYCIKHENAKNLEDWFFRRTSIGYQECKGIKCVAKTAEKFAEQLGWGEAYRNKAIRKYLNAAKQLGDLSDNLHTG